MGAYFNVRGFFHSARQNPVEMEEWTLFFEKMTHLLTHTKVRQYLTHSSVTNEQKFHFLDCLGICKKGAPQANWLAILLKKRALNRISQIAQNWSEMIEDLHCVGTIEITSPMKLDLAVEQKILAMFQAKQPGRVFSLKYKYTVRSGYVAIFRDLILEMDPGVLISRLILKLRKGY